MTMIVLVVEGKNISMVVIKKRDDWMDIIHIKVMFSGMMGLGGPDMKEIILMIES
jgi:hypothetical protein